jgi:gliding motility-associated-like protein
MTISTALIAALSIAANPTMICPGTDVTFTASPVNEGSAPAFQWLVNGILAQQGTLAVYTTDTLQPGHTVTCILTSSLTCVAQQSVTSLPVTITAAPTPLVTLTDKDFLCTGTTTPLDAGVGFASYLWQDGSSSRYLNISGEGIYWVMVVDSLGCSGSDSVLVKSCSGNIYVPNAFTPNGDGLNDIFRVSASPDDITEFSMVVFNRWGEQLFISNDLTTGWDGIVKGQYCPPDTYVWIVSYKGTSGTGETVILKGTVELIR